MLELDLFLMPHPSKYCDDCTFTGCNGQGDNLIGPSPPEETILAGTAEVTLGCSLREGGTVNVIQWVEILPGGGIKQIYVATVKDDDPKYTNFDLDSDEATYWNLIFRNVEAEDGGTYACENFGTDESYSVVRTVEGE